MGEMNSNAGLFHSETTPNLCDPPRWRPLLWAGNPSLWCSDRSTSHSACTQADPDKGVAGIPSHAHRDDLSLPSVVGVYQVTGRVTVSMIPESWLWLRTQPRESSDLALLWTELTSFLLPSSGGEEGILHKEGKRTHLLTTYWMQTLHLALSDLVVFIC